MPSDKQGFDDVIQWLKNLFDMIKQGFLDVLEWLKEMWNIVKQGFMDVVQWLKDLWNTLSEIPQAVWEAFKEAITDIGKTIQSFFNFWKIDPNNIKDAVGKMEKFTGFDKFTMVFTLYQGLTNFVIEYPKIEIDTPVIIAQFYKQPTIVLLDFGDYKQYCIWARRFFSACAWFAYGYGMIKKFRPRFVLNA